VGHLWQLDLALSALEVRMERAAEVVHEAEAQVVTAQEALAAAAKDRRVLDRLKERHAESYRAEFALKDRIAMDEIALAQFTRKDDESPSAASDDSTTHSLPSSSPRPTDRPTR
jgi:flagellar FliJ protein